MADQTNEKRILVIDDDKFIIVWIKRALKRKNANILIDYAMTTAEALEMVASQEYDLILTDYHLPRYSGAQLIDAIRTVKPHVPIIMMSASSPQELGSKIEGLNVNGFIEKKPEKMKKIWEYMTAVMTANAAPPTNNN